MKLFCTAPVAALIIAVSAHALLHAPEVQAPDVRAVLAPVQHRIETADYRATGQLVRVDASGKRTNYAISIKAHWFSGLLRTLVEIVPPKDPANKEDARIRILLEMHPNGEDSIRVFHPHQSTAVFLPSEKWSDGLFGGVFSYEDLLEPEYFWPAQSILKSAKFGARDCDVLKSTPGPSDHTHYADVQTWLDHSIGFPVYAEKALKDGGIVKEFTYFGLRQSSGVWSATQVEAKIRGRAGATLLIVKRGSEKANLSVKDFSPEQIGHFEDHP
jgi:Outer membrane lipoprotein-sorting protein